MPSDIQTHENLTTDAIVTILGRLGLWEVPHLPISVPSVITMASVV